MYLAFTKGWMKKSIVLIPFTSLIKNSFLPSFASHVTVTIGDFVAVFV